MSALIDELKQRKIFLLDGATGTELQKKGFDFGKEVITAHQNKPMLVKDLASEYVAAGSDIILTNTFSASRPSLKRYKLAYKLAQVNYDAAWILKNIKGVGYVAGSVGPSTEMFESYSLSPGKGFSREQFYGAFKEQIQALKNAGVGLIALETFMCYEEAEQALKASKDLGMTTVVSFAFNYSETKDYFATIYGVNIDKLVSLEQADIVGFNCGDISLEQAVELTKRIKERTDKPVWAKPNAGSIQEPDKLATPDEFAEYGERIIDAGANLVGGCCGTTPAHISSLKRIIDRYEA